MHESPVALGVEDHVGVDAERLHAFLARKESRTSRGLTWSTDMQGLVTAAAMQARRLGHTLVVSKWQFLQQVPPVLLVEGRR